MASVFFQKMRNALIIVDIELVGTGSAGRVLVNRLSADPNVKVVLFEAGPMGCNPNLDLCNETEPDAGLNGRATAINKNRK